MAVVVIGAAVLFAVDWLHTRGHHLRAEIAARPLVLRWAVYIGAVLLVMILAPTAITMSRPPLSMPSFRKGALQ